MLKFFQNIRSKLLSKNQFGNYLIYAIGEIILVVIGILIAIQINNWNEQRKAGKMEQHFIKMILSDADGSIEDLEHTIRGARRQENAGKYLFREMGLPHQRMDSIDTSFLSSRQNQFLSDLATSIHFLSRTLTFQSSQSAYDELVASGNISLIQDLDLRSRITLFYKELEDREFLNHRYKGYEDRYIEGLQLAGIAVRDDSPDKEIKEKFLNSPVAIAAARNQLRSVEGQIRYCNDIIKFVQAFKQEVIATYGLQVEDSTQ